MIDDDLALLHTLARWVERLFADGKRLKPREVVAEFDVYLHDELDLVREAANAAQLRRNMDGLNLVMIPEMVWELCTSGVIVMERMHGVPISQIERLREAGVDIKKLARDGVTIFFTQVFRDGFFHADMHPGNIQVSLAPRTFGRYIALDFGIIGTLTEIDKEYLAQNFIAFFRRDYKRVAELHVESGWVPPQHAHRCAGRRDPRGLRAAFRPPAEGHLARPGADAAVPDLAPLQRRDPAAAGAAAEDPAQHRGPGPPARPRPRPVDHRQALPRALDERAGRLARPARAPGASEAPRYAQLLPELPRLVHQALQRQAGGTRVAGAAGAAGRAARAPAALLQGLALGGSRASCLVRCSTTLPAACRTARSTRARRGSGRHRIEGFRNTRGTRHADLRLSLQLPVATRRTCCRRSPTRLLTDCPACGQATYTKQVTAAGFQLKGSGWYVTDFRGGNKAEAQGGRRARRTRLRTTAAAPAGEQGGRQAARTRRARSRGRDADRSQAGAEGGAKAAARRRQPTAGRPSRRRRRCRRG